jgi:hypothetical protein
MVQMQELKNITIIQNLMLMGDTRLWQKNRQRKIIFPSLEVLNNHAINDFEKKFLVQIGSVRRVEFVECNLCFGFELGNEFGAELGLLHVFMIKIVNVSVVHKKNIESQTYLELINNTFAS